MRKIKKIFVSNWYDNSISEINLLQKKVDRDALIVGARKAIKRAEQKKFDSQSKQPKMVKAYDKRTGQARFVLQSDIMKNPSGFTPISGTVADMLRVSDRKKQEQITRFIR